MRLVTAGGRPDPRRAAYRDDLADERLRGVVEATRFVTPERRQVIAPSAALRREPRPDAGLDTEALRGETVRVFEEREGFAWGQLERDGYVGYMPTEALGEIGAAPTHRVAVLRTFIYPAPDLKTPPIAWLSLNSRVTARDDRNGFVRLPDSGFVFARHLKLLGDTAEDFVAVAESFVGTPYLWGGRTSLGLDCSALIQLALESAGETCPRDTDMQQEEVGKPVSGSDTLRRGDLIFWRGHVGVMTDRRVLLHANAHHMATASEPLAEARTRIAATGDDVIAVKRPSSGRRRTAKGEE